MGRPLDFEPGTSDVHCKLQWDTMELTIGSPELERQIERGCHGKL